jgi:hypothetical protein
MHLLHRLRLHCPLSGPQTDLPDYLAINLQMGLGDAGRAIAFGALIAAIWALLAGGATDLFGGAPMQLTVWSLVGAVATGFVFLRNYIAPQGGTVPLPALLASLGGVELADSAVWVVSEVVLAAMAGSQGYLMALGFTKCGAGVIDVSLTFLLNEFAPRAKDQNYHTAGLVLDSMRALQFILMLVVLLKDRCQVPGARLGDAQAPFYAKFEFGRQRRAVDDESGDGDERRALTGADDEEAQDAGSARPRRSGAGMSDERRSLTADDEEAHGKGM